MIRGASLGVNSCCWGLSHSTDLGVGGSNPSGRARFNNLRAAGLIFSSCARFAFLLNEQIPSLPSQLLSRFPQKREINHFGRRTFLFYFSGCAHKLHIDLDPF
jgi:hypothetical protein